MITVERSIWIDAPRQRVWEAITEPEQMAHWFLPALSGMPLKRDDSGNIAISFGPMESNFVLLELADPPRKAVAVGLPDRQIKTTYMLEEQDGGTRITVIMSGFESLPEDAREDRLAQSGSAWEQTLANLKAFVGDQPLPFPYAAVAPLFGYWRTAPRTISVERSIWIDAPRERVWEAITVPEQIAQWFSPGTQWRGDGLKVGGKFGVYDPETDSDMYVQTIEALDPPRQLVTKNDPEPPEKPHTTKWTLLEEDGGTRLTITYTGPEDSHQQNMEQNAFGFGMMLENTKAYVEGMSLPFPGGF